MIIVKNRDVSANWFTYVKLLGANKYLLLDATSAVSTDTDTWNNTDATNTVFHLGGQWQTTGNGNNHIAYCFHSVDGYSKVGSYTGNGSSDGTFVYTGFRPAYVMIKAADAVEPWMPMDVAREPTNLNDAQLQANSSSAETQDGNGLDMLSNGFKLRSAIGNWGSNGVTYIYLAFAEAPFKHTNAR